jgi:hypothetical protein
MRDAMWQTWESLKISTARRLIAAVQSDGGNGVDPIRGCTT